MNGSRRGGGVDRTIRSLFDDAGVRGWLHVAELDRPSAHVVLDPDEQVPMGSVYKVPLMTAFCRLAEAGRIDPSHRLTLETADRVPGPTGLSILRDPVTMSLRDLVVQMMSVSDNTAAHAVLRAVGPEAVDRVCADLGLPHTRIHGGVVGTFDRLVADTGAGSLDAAMDRVADNDTVVPRTCTTPRIRPPPHRPTSPGCCGRSGRTRPRPPVAAPSCGRRWAPRRGPTVSPPDSRTTT
ncbi:Beta-lactamase enzyme family protein [Streptomyces sp. CA-256286]|nr:Beta-lactamase enzyme family protein [Streptomyces sp. CA-256286]